MTVRIVAYPPARRQAGAALVMGMIFLVLITVLGLTTLGVSALEERMASNARDRVRAFQAAEAALRYCEEAITPYTLFNGSNGMYQPAAAGQDPRWETANVWTGTNSAERDCDGATCISLVDEQPRCIAEELPNILQEGSLKVGESGTSETYRFYRVTARGVGVSDKTVVMLQSTLKRKTGGG